MSTMPARIVHIGIDRNWREVYAFASIPENMPLWASGLASGLKPDGEDWLGDGGPIGTVRIRFTPTNGFGVLDHTVTMENGLVVENALRVVPNGSGAEVMFTLLRLPDTGDEAFEADAAHIRKDLETLKRLMEDGEPASAPASAADRKIDYIEFQIADIPAAKEFYGSAFGWSFTDYGPDYCEFRDGRLSGGFAKSKHGIPSDGALVIIFVDRLEDAQARVEAAGGTIVKPIFAFPGGRRFHFVDREGYELAVWSDR